MDFFRDTGIPDGFSNDILGYPAFFTFNQYERYSAETYTPPPPALMPVCVPVMLYIVYRPH